MTSKFGGLGQSAWDAVQDLAGQLTEVKDGSGSTLYEFGYDHAGNRTSMSGGGVTGSYTFIDVNQLVGMTVNGESSTLAYDPNGNLTSDGERTYTWVAADRQQGEPDEKQRWKAVEAGRHGVFSRRPRAFATCASCTQLVSRLVLFLLVAVRSPRSRTVREESSR